MDKEKFETYGPARIQFAHDVSVMDLYAKYFMQLRENSAEDQIETKETEQQDKTD